MCIASDPLLLLKLLPSNNNNNNNNNNDSHKVTTDRQVKHADCKTLHCVY
jgi:hypothetical protein